MIKDPVALTSINQQWATVRNFCRSGHGHPLAAGFYINETPPEEFYNLPFVLAFATLDDVLGQMIAEGVFKCPGARPMLGQKMARSRAALAWQDFTAVETAKDKRNDLAHQGVLQPKSECLRIVGLIEIELKAWGLI